MGGLGGLLRVDPGQGRGQGGRLAGEARQVLRVSGPIAPEPAHQVLLTDQPHRQPLARTEFGIRGHVVFQVRRRGRGTDRPGRRPGGALPAVFQVNLNQFFQQLVAGVRVLRRTVCGESVQEDVEPGRDAATPGHVEEFQQLLRFRDISPQGVRGSKHRGHGAASFGI